jgi:hypothetical protein
MPPNKRDTARLRLADYTTDKRPPSDVLRVSLCVIDGELGKRAQCVRRMQGLSVSAFIRACVAFTLEHMESEQ